MRAGKARERVMKIGEKHSDERETSRWKVVFVGFRNRRFVYASPTGKRLKNCGQNICFSCKKLCLTVFNMLPSKL